MIESYTPTTWDDLTTTDWDSLYTYDDPMGNVRLDAAYAAGGVSRDGPLVTINWGNGQVVDGLDTPLARDDFNRTAVPAPNWGTSNLGYVWTASINGFSTDGTHGLIKPIALNTIYSATVNGISTTDFDIAAKVKATSLFAGSRGSIYMIGRQQQAAPGDAAYMRLDFNADQIMGYALQIIEGGSFRISLTGLIHDIIHTTGTWFWIRMQGVGQTIRAKVWTDGDPEPGTWKTSLTDTWLDKLPGRVGIGGLLDTGATNPLPYVEFQVDEFISGLHTVAEVGATSAGNSLDDGLPSAATNTSALGVNELSADLLSPIGTDPAVYWSTFRADQYWSDTPRDVAQVAFSSPVLASDGIRSPRVFTGQMIDMPTNDRKVVLKGVSGSRLKLSTLVQPPAVYGFYEGANANFPIMYALLKSGMYVAPPPQEGCRLYMPMSGSVRPMIPDVNQAALPVQGFAHKPTGIVFERPTFIDGPFLEAVECKIDASGVKGIAAWPGGNLQSAPGADYWSQASPKGRIECWIKGIATDVANSLSPSEQQLMVLGFTNQAVSTRCVEIGVSVGRTTFILIDDGVTQVILSGPILPVDNQWHFLGGSWDLTTGDLRLRLDTTELSQVAGFTAFNLGATDATYQLRHIMRSVIPICEVRFTSGTFGPSAKAQWANQVAFEPDVIMRRSLIQLEAVAEMAPREAFEMIQSYAKGDLAKTGFDERDRFLYLTPSYWAEGPQQVVQETLSTENNMARFQPERPASKIFNQVGLTYRKGSVQENFSMIISQSQLVPLAPGATVSLDIPTSAPTVEINNFTLSALTGAALAGSPPSVNNAFSYYTANTATDGTGSYANSSQVSGVITAWDPGRVVVTFRNLTGVNYWITNNVSIPPLGVAGKILDSGDATVEGLQPDSIARRGTRVLRISVPAIQATDHAQRIADEMASILGEPRVTFTAAAWGDGRRAPGDLVLVDDPDQTGINGSYRLSAVSSTHQGDDLQQVIAAVVDWPVMVWGEGIWGETVWGDGS